jgi:hypothetical protein
MVVSYPGSSSCAFCSWCIVYGLKRFSAPKFEPTSRILRNSTAVDIRQSDDRKAEVVPGPRLRQKSRLEVRAVGQVDQGETSTTRRCCPLGANCRCSAYCPANSRQAPGTSASFSGVHRCDWEHSPHPGTTPARHQSLSSARPAIEQRRRV